MALEALKGLPKRALSACKEKINKLESFQMHNINLDAFMALMMEVFLEERRRALIETNALFRCGCPRSPDLHTRIQTC